MAAPRYLADTNILVRLAKRNDPEFSLVRGALRALLAQGATPLLHAANHGGVLECLHAPC